MHKIEHDANEPVIDRSNRIFWFAGALLALLWASNLIFVGVDWPSVCLGAFTGVAIAVWAIETTDNKNPEWLVPRNSYWSRRTRKQL